MNKSILYMAGAFMFFGGLIFKDQAFQAQGVGLLFMGMAVK